MKTIKELVEELLLDGAWCIPAGQYDVMDWDEELMKKDTEKLIEDLEKLFEEQVEDMELQAKDDAQRFGV